MMPFLSLRGVSIWCFIIAICFALLICTFGTMDTASITRRINNEEQLPMKTANQHQKQKYQQQGALLLVSIPLLSSSQLSFRRQRRRQKQNNKTNNSNNSLVSSYSSSPLYRGYGTHYVDLWVGTPTAQRQTVIVDTGSSVTAFPCKGCKNCGYDNNKQQYHIDSYFDPSLSQTFKKLSCRNGGSKCKIGTCSTKKEKQQKQDDTCQISLSYVEGSSWHAYEATDFIYSGGTHHHNNNNDTQTEDTTYNFNTSNFKTSIHFGCQTSVTGLFRTQLADGIMGMTKHGNSFWHQMYNYGSIHTKQFSLCFRNERHVTREGTHAGVMTLGGSDTRTHKTSMIYAQELSRSSPGSKDNYHVYIEKVFLQNNNNNNYNNSNKNNNVQVTIDVAKLNSNNRGAMIDSGTTDTYFSSCMKKPIKKAWHLMMGFEYGSDETNFTTIDQLPTIILQLRGTTSNSSIFVGIPPANYISIMPKENNSNNNNNNNNKQPSLDYHVHLGTGSTVTLGANFLSGYDVLFDIDNNRIGFAQSDCQVSTTTTTIMNSGSSNSSSSSSSSSNHLKQEEEELQIMNNNTNSSSSGHQQQLVLPTSKQQNTTTLSNNSEIITEVQVSNGTSTSAASALAITNAEERESPNDYFTPPLQVEQDKNTTSTTPTTATTKPTDGITNTSAAQNDHSSSLQIPETSRGYRNIHVYLLFLCGVVVAAVILVRHQQYRHSTMEDVVEVLHSNDENISATREILPLINVISSSTTTNDGENRT